MRRPLLLLTCLCFGPVAAFAQAQPQAAIVPSTQQPAPATDTATTIPITTPATVAPGKEEIGYDPKVKRDINGKVIGEAAPVAPPTESEKLRKDTNLRSDKRLLTPATPAGTATGTAPASAGTDKSQSGKTGFERTVIQNGVIKVIKE